MRNRLVWLVTAALTAGCGGPPVPPPPPPAPAPAAVTDDDARQFGERLAKAATGGDREAAERLIRFKEISLRVIDGLDASRTFRAGALRGLRRADTADAANRLVDAVTTGGRYDLLRVRPGPDGRLRVLMRFVGILDEFDYHEFTVTRYPDGEVGAEDMLVLSAGEPVSATMRRLVAVGAAEYDRALAEGFRRADMPFVEAMPKIAELTRAVKENRCDEAMEVYRSLSPEVRKNKTVLLLALRVAKYNDADHSELAGLFRAEFPGDPAVEVIALNHHLLRDEHAEALACVGRIDERVGGDPFLDRLRAEALIGTGDLVGARAAAERCVAALPDYDSAYWTRVRVALKARDHADALDWLRRLYEAREASIDEDFLAGEDDYADFTLSAECAELLGWYAARRGSSAEDEGGRE